MHDAAKWTRRRLLKASGAAAGAGVASYFGVASHAEPPDATAEAQNLFVYEAIAGRATGKQGVQVHAARGSRWRPLQFVASVSPSSLVIAPHGRTLYVTNHVGRYKGLATGSVEAWAIDPVKGTLTRLNRQGLALAAVSPTHAAVSPDGATLAVSAADGGSCVLLPIREDGSVGEPTAVRKQIRTAPLAAGRSARATSQLSFAPDGRLLMADYAEHSLSVFEVRGGPVELVQRVPLPQMCASGRMQRKAGSLEISLQDDKQRTLTTMLYAGALTTSRSVSDDAAANTSRADILARRATQLAEVVPGREAFYIDTGGRQGSCFLRSPDGRVPEAFRPGALAWVYA